MTALTLACALLAPPPADNPIGLLATFGGRRIGDHEHLPLSPDGTRLTWVADGRTVVFDVAGGPPREQPVDGELAGRGVHAVWPAGGELRWVAWGPTGFACLVRRPDGSVDLPAAPPPGRYGLLQAARLSPDGKTVLTVWEGGERDGRRTELWPFVPGKGSDQLTPLREVELDPQGDRPLQSGDFSSDSSHFLWVVPSRRRVVGYALATGKQAWEVEPPAGAGLVQLAASADGRAVVVLLLVAGTANTEASVWDAPTGRRLRTLPADGPAKRADRTLAVTPDGRRAVLLAPTTDGRLGGAVVDPATGVTVRALDPLPVVTTPAPPAVSADSRRLAVFGTNTVGVWDLTSGKDAQPAGGHRGAVTSVVLSKDNRWVVSAGADQMIRCWSAETGAERWAVGTPVDVSLLGLTPDGAGVLVAGGGAPALRKSLPRAVRVADGRPLDLPPALADPAGELAAFSPSGQTVAVVTATGLRLAAWPAGFTRRVVRFPAPGDGVRRLGVSQVRFTPDGEEVVAVASFVRQTRDPAATDWHRVERYSAETGELLSDVAVPANRPLVLPAFGRLAYLATAGDASGLPLFAAADGKLVGRLGRADLPFPGRMRVPVAAVAPGGRRLLYAAADGVAVFDPADGGHRGVWPARVRATALAFSPDGTRLVTGDAAGVGRVWDADRRLP